ncbi:hypothetical protein PENVUL_c019G08892 [Penicillium vulpinum]|uniref:Uncharacterized protein n=1 Tax=Penicillium vulpinum TaxID=29845 RepID=A0A1V6RX59_9EURO|nr:hypothetical protein PENVUL_c019G08892 [Penicillium vulpinum]
MITRESRRQISGGFSTNREYATVIEAILATGTTIAPIVLGAKVLLLLRWFEIWIQLFNKPTKDSAKGS